MPGCAWRRRAISSVTLWPGSCPPSPGFAPCAILISSSSACTRYSAVTPKRALATCLILLFSSDGAPLTGVYTSGSSPPSPVFDRAPSRFIASVMVWCASGESDPNDMALAMNVRVMVLGRSHLLERNSAPAGRISSRSRRCEGRGSAACEANVAKGASASAAPCFVDPTTVCRARTVVGCHECDSASSALRNRTKP